MDAVIKVSSSEFNEELFNKIRSLLKGRDADVTIAVTDKSGVFFKTETAEEFWLQLNKSIEDIKQGAGTTFTMEELESFINK